VKAPGHPYPDRVSLGRARNCDLVLRDASISKLHAHFRRTAEGAQVFDLVDCCSQNGTRLNDKALEANQPTGVKTGDRMVFGRVPAKLLDAPALYEVLQILARMQQQIAEPRSKA
jgi:hypothetical protein